MEKFAEILETAKQPTLKDHIMRKCNLSNKAFDIYAKRLIEYGLMRASDAGLRLPGNPGKNRVLYQTTEKGLEFLNRYRQLITVLEIKCCVKCGRQLSEDTRSVSCPYCGGALQTKFVLKRKA